MLYYIIRIILYNSVHIITSYIHCEERNKSINAFTTNNTMRICRRFEPSTLTLCISNTEKIFRKSTNLKKCVLGTGSRVSHKMTI